MAVSGPFRRNQNEELEYLCVDAFINGIVEARALATAFELRLIDHLREKDGSSAEEFERGFPGDRRGMQLLLDLLVANHVIEESRGEIKLTQAFTKALKYRDLLEAKLEFANFVLPDFTNLFTTLVSSPERFGHNARTFELFGYHRCFDHTPENYELTKRWMRITTALTKYEARVCMRYHDFSPYRNILDVGGNSGEFVLQVCEKYPLVSATVFDLPLVCAIGQEHVKSKPESDRITFIEGDALRDDLPKGFDLISFKSMLHDWPEEEAKEFIARSSHSLKPGGTLLIFERGPLEIGGTPLPYSMIPFLLFFRSFRSPAIYEAQLRDLSFQEIKVQRIDLETTFHLITASKR